MPIALAEVTVNNGVVNFYLNPVVGLLLFAVVVVAVIYGIWTGFCAIARWNSGWKTLAGRFPMKNVESLGQKYTGQTGYFNARGWRSSVYTKSMFSVELAREGAVITPYFARKLPLFIPWAEICAVEDATLFGTEIVQISAYYDKTIVDSRYIMRFTIPPEALALILEKVPAEILHKTSSFSELLKNRFNDPRNG